MAKKPNTFAFQDLPPEGGYPKIPTTRGIRPRGPPGWAIWLGILTASAYGFYRIGQTGNQSRVLRKEKREARMATLAFLQAEKDIEMDAKIREAIKIEKEIMKNVPDWEAGKSPYSKRKMNPAFRNNSASDSE